MGLRDTNWLPLVRVDLRGESPSELDRVRLPNSCFFTAVVISLGSESVTVGQMGCDPCARVGHAQLLFE
jgi:hypothetical protein